MTSGEPLSNSRVNRAGDRLRRYVDAEMDLGDEDLEGEIEVVAAFRRLHGPPLSRVAAGLRYYVAKNSQLMIVGQRLKRTPTIVDKLFRHPKMKLSRMHDVGGCRAVVESDEAVNAIARELKRQRRWEIARDYDYIASPKVDGYRAYHLVVEKDGFLVEVQLRSAAQHAWAEAIEAADRDNPLLGLKEGRAPDLHVEYYRLGAQLLAHRERSEVPEHEVLSRFRDLHQRVIRPR